MDSEDSLGTRRQLVVSAAASHKDRKVSLSDRMVRVTKPIALQPDEQAFVEKTLHYISGIKGVIANDLVLSTNTKFPTRYIVMIKGLPLMTMEDFEHIQLMNDNIRSIRIDMACETIQIDVWRVGNRVSKKRKRKRDNHVITSQYDLTSVDRRDRGCLRQLLMRLNALEDIECQFDLSIDTSQPESYRIDLSIFDTLSIQSLKQVLHECRSFCRAFDMDFPHKVIRATCLRLAAPLKRRILRIKN